MSKLITSLLLAIALFGSVSAASARAQPWTDMSDPYGGYAPDSQEGTRAFWDYQTRHGGN